MTWRIVLQPNGKLARFSEAADGFSHFNMTPEQAIHVCRRLESITSKEAQEHVEGSLEDAELSRWRDSLAVIEKIHGEESVKRAIRADASPRQRY